MQPKAIIITAVLAVAVVIGGALIAYFTITGNEKSSSSAAASSTSSDASNQNQQFSWPFTFPTFKPFTTSTATTTSFRATGSSTQPNAGTTTTQAAGATVPTFSSGGQFRSIAMTVALKHCLNEAAFMAYVTGLGADYTYYINHAPAGATVSNGRYQLNGGTVGTTAASSIYCGQVLGSGESIIGFQGSNGGNDNTFDTEGGSDNFIAGYDGSLGVDTTVQYTYCVGHSLGGARARWAGSMGLCKNVVTFASPIVAIGVVPSGSQAPTLKYTGSNAGTYPLPNSAYPPIVSFQRVRKSTTACSGGGDAYIMDCVTMEGYGTNWASLNPNILYTMDGNPDSFSSVEPGSCPITLTSSLQQLNYNMFGLHLMGNNFPPFNAETEGY